MGKIVHIYRIYYSNSVGWWLHFS